MRSQTIDQLVSTYLRQPVALSWDGTLADPLRGSFDGVRLAFGGVATTFLPLEEVVLAAKRAGIRAVVLPEKNRQDVDEIQETLLEGLELRFVGTIDEALELTLSAPDPREEAAPALA